MFRYFLRRFALVIPTFLGITMVCFCLTQFVPGGPVEQSLMAIRGLGGGNAPAATQNAAEAPVDLTGQLREQLNAHYGFDRPIPVRYFNWLIKDRCGLRTHSYHYTDKTAWDLIRARIPVSLWFGIPGFFLTYLICIPLGIAKALRRGTPFDLGSSLIVFIGYAIPPFAFGMLVKMLFCGTVDGLWDILPLGGIESENALQLSTADRFVDRFRHMLLPVLCYMIGSFAMLTLLVKNTLLDQMSANYIRTILAKGATLRHAVWRHALRNALIPVATGFGGILTLIFAGSVIIENVFDIPGMGRLALESLETRDYPVFLGLMSVNSALGLLGQILSDFCYVLIDPRIRFDR